MIGRSWVVALVLMVLALPASGQSVRAWVDRTTVFLGETVTLRIEVSEELTGTEPDLAPLADNFRVLSTGSSTQMSFVNGRQSVSAQWVIQLEPVNTGTLEIPPIRVGAVTSEPLRVAVMEAPASSDASGAPDLLVSLEVDPPNPYVQQQAKVVVKLYHALPITEGSLTEPSVDNGLLQRLGEDVTYAAERSGRRYQVVERRYALFPEHSGPMTINSVQFRGRVSDRNNGQRLSFFNPGRSVQAASDAVSLDVRPRPAQWSGGTWLPARSLQLEQNWGADELNFRAGEPVTRTITIEGQGLPQTLLPVVGEDPVPGIRIYPDQPETRERTDGQWVYSSRSQKLAIVPQQAGTLQLPEIRVPWWNVVTDQPEVAIIPAQTLIIAPPLVAQEPAVGAGSTPIEGERVEMDTQQSPPSQTDQSYLLVWAIVATVLWLFSAVAWWRAKSATPSRPGVDHSHVAKQLNQAAAGLRSALRSGDSRALARAICQQAETDRPGSARNLRHLAPALEPDAAKLMQQLDHLIYAEGATQVPPRLSDALRSKLSAGIPWQSVSKDDAKGTGLPSLFPLSART